MKREIRSKILRSDLVDWHEFEFIQTENFKDLSNEAGARLRESILRNGFVESFKVWQSGRKIFCLDGFHRCQVLRTLEEEGFAVPKEFRADFLDCRNRKEAAKLVLIYSSIYASITEEGLYEFQNLNELDFESLAREIDLPEFNLERFMQGWIRDDESQEDAKRTIQERFIVPPFSVLDTRQGYWQRRAAAWDRLIGDHGESREHTLVKSGSKAETHLNISSISTVSILDAVLAELAVQWFCPAGGSTFDSFAGDTVFGFVSGFTGHPFTGIELRPEQAKTNQSRVDAMKLPAKYICDDARRITKHLKPASRDFLFSCPPYFNLERYSKLEADASNQKSYPDFLSLIEEAFTGAIKILRENRFAVIVVGDIRDPRGYYRGFPADVVRIFERAGMPLYNEMILLNVAGKAGMKVDGQFTTYRKTVKVHQNVLVFYKGDPKAVKANFGVIDLNGTEDPVQTFLKQQGDSHACADV